MVQLLSWVVSKCIFCCQLTLDEDEKSEIYRQKKMESVDIVFFLGRDLLSCLI
jgi:hypothetical protein